MKEFLSLYFFAIAAIQVSLALGIWRHFQSQAFIDGSKYWPISIYANSFALIIFGCGLILIDDVSRPIFIFTIANTLFYISLLYKALYCASLNRNIGKKHETYAIASVLIFMFFFEYLRHTSTFEIRTCFMATLALTSCSIQIREVNNFNRMSKINELKYFQIATGIEFLLAVVRIFVISLNGVGVVSLDTLPKGLIPLTFFQLVMNTLSYIVIAGYKFGKISYANAKVEGERFAAEQSLRETQELLKEKERLIYGLLKANKTAATGALSASIAHELNQPLGSTSLNIEFLKMKLANGVLNPEVGKEILDALDEDNRRAATIVKSLRSIFTEGESNIQDIELSVLISTVLDIVKPELKLKNIQVQHKIDNDLLIKVNNADIEQVVLNLINNAIQSLANSGTLQRRISIEAFEDGRWAKLIISDNGPGVLEKFKPQLFELLSTTKQTGMGLGLWLCKHIVTRYMGTIEYEGTLGGGATFLIRLPLGH
jgi:signal transduction histidine kinase